MGTIVGSDSGGGVLVFRPCLGDEDIVVTVVVAVRGLSPDMEDIAAAEEEGNFPVNSSFRILDFRSSNSSHTVDGAVVDRVDSVPSCFDLSISTFDRSGVSALDKPVTVRLPDKLDGLYERDWPESCIESLRSAVNGCEVSGDNSRLERPSLLRGGPTEERALTPKYRRRFESSRGCAEEEGRIPDEVPYPTKGELSCENGEVIWPESY